MARIDFVNYIGTFLLCRVHNMYLMHSDAFYSKNKKEIINNSHVILSDMFEKHLMDLMNLLNFTAISFTLRNRNKILSSGTVTLALSYKGGDAVGCMGK